MVERRRFLRVGVRIFIDVFIKGDLRTRGRGVISDIGIGGMALETKEDLEIDDVLILRFNLDVNTLFDLKGRIIRKEKKPALIKYGIKFTKIGFFEKIRLKRFVVIHR